MILLKSFLKTYYYHDLKLEKPDIHIQPLQSYYRRALEENTRVGSSSTLKGKLPLLIGHVCSQFNNLVTIAVDNGCEYFMVYRNISVI